MLNGQLKCLKIMRSIKMLLISVEVIILMMSLAQQIAELNPVLESPLHYTPLAVLSEVSENAWSASLARRRSQLTLKQVRQRGDIKRLYVLKPLGYEGNTTPASAWKDKINKWT